MEDKKQNNRSWLDILLFLSILIIPYFLNGFISFTDWIQFGVVIILLCRLGWIEIN